jgi:MFS family permease
MAGVTEQATDETRGWLARPVVSLSYPHFRLFWFSNLVVAMGLMVQFTARGWLIVDLTKSAFLLGVVDAAWALAAGLGSIPMGIVADRVNRRNLLAAGNVVILASAFAIGLLVATDLIAIWYIIVAASLEGLLFAGRIPAGQAMTARLVPEEHLMNAVSLNSAGHSLPSIAGPAVGGVLVASLGIAAAYFTTVGALVVALLLMLAVAASFGHIERDPAKSVLHDVREGWSYLRAHRDLIRLTLAMLIPYVLGQSYVLLLPLFVEKELHSGPQVFGALSACLGAGSVVGAAAVATFGKQRQIGLLMFLGVLGTGVATIVYSLSQWPVLTGAVLLGAGIAQATLFAAYETLLVVRLPDAMRGRVLGLLFTIIGVFPASAMVAGAVADVIGLRSLALVEGIIIVSMAYVAWRVALRQAMTAPEPALADDGAY